MEPRPAGSRLIDANTNRAAEGLRVAEDVCRFHWNLAGFARELKELRHELLAIAAGSRSARNALLAARDAAGDCGRSQESPGSAVRGAVPDLAGLNLQRACEAVRVLEEVVRIEDPRAAARLESLRYRLYSIQKGVSLLSEPHARRDRLADVRVYLLATTALARSDLVETVGRAVRAGAGAVQLRETERSDRELLETALRLRETTARLGALFLVNDRPDIACLSHADGVHLGQRDLPAARVRSFVGPECLIGVSTHSVEEARAATCDGADYVGVGPVFRSATKDAGPPLGPEGLERVLQDVALPAFAIGGIGPSNVRAVRAAGARRIAVSSAALSAEDIEAVVSELRAALE